MIKKFQLGGASLLSILALIQLLPKELQLHIMLAFSLWAQLKGVDILLLQQNPQALELALGQFMLEMQSQQTQAAKHGTKLQYIKSLKNQCPEGEELYYYKKGGSVGCGCKKKEDGGEVEKAQKGAIAQFKNAYNKKKLELNTKVEQAKQAQAKKKKLAEIDRKSLEDYEKGWTNEASAVNGKKCGGKVKKDACGSKIKKDCNGAVAKFKAACGSKIKKNQYGGSLNGIPFYLGGTPEDGILDNIKIQKPIIPYTLVKPLLLPQITINGIRRKNLPNFTVIGQNLNKTYPFPYGEIIVEKSPENGKTISYPTTNSPLGLLVMRSKAIRNARGNRGDIF